MLTKYDKNDKMHVENVQERNFLEIKNPTPRITQTIVTTSTVSPPNQSESSSQAMFVLLFAQAPGSCW